MAALSPLRVTVPEPLARSDAADISAAAAPSARWRAEPFSFRQRLAPTPAKVPCGYSLRGSLHAPCNFPLLHCSFIVLRPGPLACPVGCFGATRPAYRNTAFQLRRKPLQGQADPDLAVESSGRVAPRRASDGHWPLSRPLPLREGSVVGQRPELGISPHIVTISPAPPPKTKVAATGAGQPQRPFRLNANAKDPENRPKMTETTFVRTGAEERAKEAKEAERSLHPRSHKAPLSAFPCHVVVRTSLTSPFSCCPATKPTQVLESCGYQERRERVCDGNHRGTKRNKGTKNEKAVRAVRTCPPTLCTCLPGNASRPAE